MPYLCNLTRLLLDEDRTPARLIDIFYQLAEALEYLHSLRIAHLDVCHDNFVAALPEDERSQPAVVARRVYIFDFGTSRQLTLGPGAHNAITLPPTQIPPPNGLKHFDPYSWDVYCLGHVFEDLMETYPFDGKRVPWIARRVARWLIGKERGCSAACRCRPTARQARRALSVIRFLYVLWPLHSDFTK
ncbi:kinase-like domain-containing protein [Cubamyces menziesii]|nr:kinase-like domain-containing protein [Cubamyces menziesii]